MTKTLTVWTVWMVCASLTPAAAVAQPLFSVLDHGAGAGGLRFAGPSVLRSRPAAVDAGLLRRAFSAASSREPSVSVSLNPFSDTVYRGVVEHVGPTSAGYTVSGALDGVPFGSFVLVVNGDVVVGTIRAGGEIYEISTIQPGVQAVRQIDPASIPPLDDDQVLVPGGTERAERRPDPVRVGPVGVPRGGRWSGPGRDTSGGPEDGSRIDVLMLYMPAAAEELGGADQVRATADLWIAETNRAYAESGVIHRLWPVGVQPFDDPAANVPSPNEIMDVLHTAHVGSLRDRLGADLVTLMTHHPRVRGINLFGRGQMWGPRSFACVRCDSSVFSHEVGHNMGLAHDRYVASREWANLSNYDPPYSFGFVSPRTPAGASRAERFRTIMAYPNRCLDEDGMYCKRVMYFSNPYNEYGGEPLGVPGDEPSSSIDGPADAARAMNDARRRVANWRVAPCIRDGSLVHLQAHDGHWLSAENDGGDAINANRSAPGAWETFSLLAPGGGCVGDGRAVHLRTGAGFYWRAVGGGGATLDAAGAAAGAWEAFRMHRVGGGSIRSGDFIRLQAPSGHYVVAEEGGGGAVRANRPEPGAWETFRVAVRP